MNASVAICISQKFKSVPKFRLHSQGEGGCTLVLCLPVVGRAVGSTGGLMPTHAGLPVWPLRDTAKKGGQLRVWQGGVGAGWWLSSHRGQIFISAPAAACGGKGASQGQQSWQHRVPPLAFSSAEALEGVRFPSFSSVLQLPTMKYVFVMLVPVQPLSRGACKPERCALLEANGNGFKMEVHSVNCCEVGTYGKGSKPAGSWVAGTVCAPHCKTASAWEKWPINYHAVTHSGGLLS